MKLHHLAFFLSLALISSPASAHERISKPEEVKFNIDLTARPLFKADTLRLLVVGDLMLHYPQIIKAQKEDGNFDFSNYFKHIRHYIDEADITIGNLESPICGEPYSGYPRFSAPEDFVIQLLDDGFDVLLCANNHIMDYDSRGISKELDTFKELKKDYAFSYAGISEDSKTLNLAHFIACKGIRISIVNFTYATNRQADADYPKVNLLSNKQSLATAFNLSHAADIVLAMPHWGDEYVLAHNEAQRKLAEYMINNGADIIIGTHPHVVQDRDTICGKPVFYSIGNFISNMSAKNTQLGLMIRLNIIRETNGDIKTSVPELIWTWCSRPGGFCDDYTVIPIYEFLDAESKWKGTWDYNKMLKTISTFRLYNNNGNSQN